MGKPGRKPHDPTPEQRKLVHTLAGYGVKEDDIAREIGIDPTTLRRYYKEELAMGHVRANAKVAESLYQMATSGQNVTAAIFWLKTRAQWREPKSFDMPAPVADVDESAEAKVFTLRVFDGGKPVQPLSREPILIDATPIRIDRKKPNGHDEVG
jgi:hypothetical protein